MVISFHFGRWGVNMDMQEKNPYARTLLPESARSSQQARKQ